MGKIFIPAVIHPALCAEKKIAPLLSTLTGGARKMRKPATIKRLWPKIRQGLSTMTASRAGSCALSFRLALSLPDTHERMNILQSAVPAVHGMTKRRSAARCSLWPGTNENAPAYSRWSGPGLLYALCGALRASVRRFWAREYRDSHEAIKRRDGPVNGLNGGFCF